MAERTKFTSEQKEAWTKAKDLLKIYRGSDEYRPLHIAMSELRAENGTHKGPIERISTNPDKKREYEAGIINNKIRERVQEWKAYFRNPDLKKLYIIVRDDLSPSQKAVQASHAAAEFQKRVPHAPWINGTMILMQTDPDNKIYQSYKGGRWGFKSEAKDQFEEYCKNIWSSFKIEWREPDQGNRLTAIAILSNYRNDDLGRISGIKLL